MTPLRFASLLAASLACAAACSSSSGSSGDAGAGDGGGAEAGAPEAGPDAAPAALECTFAGTWKVTYTCDALKGETVTWTFNADDTTQEVITGPDSSGMLMGTWKDYCCQAGGASYDCPTQAAFTSCTDTTSPDPSGCVKRGIACTGSFVTSGSTLNITDLDCMAINGAYVLTFDPTCKHASLKRQVDTCPVRGDCTDGLTLTLQ